MRTNIHLALSFAVITAAAGAVMTGCVASADAPSDADTVHRTIVRFSPEGMLDPTYEIVTVAQQQAELAARAAFVEASRTGKTDSQALPTLQLDSGCAGASLWLFDQANLTGDQLCLFKKPTDDAAWLDLGTVCRIFGFPLCATWSNSVRSLWAGSDPGSLQACTSTLCFATPFVNFTPFQQITSVGAGIPHPLTMAFLFTP